MSRVSKILIVGGGIGGLAAAAACGRQGIAVDLVEINPDHSVYGVGIIQPNNTLRALDSIGLADACVEKGAPSSGWDFYDLDDKLIAQAASINSASPRHPAVNGMTRPMLQTLLVAAAEEAGAKLRLGVTYSEFIQHRDRVDVEFTDGTSGSYDLIIASDGAYSKTRSLLFPDVPKPHFSGEFVWRHNFARPKDVGRGRIYYASKAKVGLVPMSLTTMYMFVVTYEPDNPWLPSERLAPMMRERLAEFRGLIATLRDQIVESAAVVVRPIESLLVPAPWHQGRVILIGDAAHATTPQMSQGAAMAIEDAVLLGELLSREAPLADLLDEFMRRRYDRCRHVVEKSNQLTQWEVEAWNGIENPDANHAQLLTEATNRLMEAY